MKLSALAALIKDCGHCCQITAANGRRFISTGYAVYNMDGYPKAKNKNELAAMLSIPEKKMEDIYFEEKTAENNVVYGVSLADDPDNEEPVDKLGTRIVVNGEEHIALRHPTGTIGFIRTAQLKPVESELTKEYAAICVRWGDWRDGMMCRTSLPAKRWEISCAKSAQRLRHLSHTFLQRIRTTSRRRIFRRRRKTISTARTM